VTQKLKGMYAPKEDRHKVKKLIEQYRNFDDCVDSSWKYENLETLLPEGRAEELLRR
jgi:hypothetical protein